MSFEEEFDGIIRRKAEDADYPFNEKDWEKMKGVLDATRAPKGGIQSNFLRKTLAALSMAAGIAVVVLMYRNETVEPVKTIAVNTETTSSSAATAASAANGNNIVNEDGSNPAEAQVAQPNSAADIAQHNLSAPAQPAADQNTDRSSGDNRSTTAGNDKEPIRPDETKASAPFVVAASEENNKSEAPLVPSTAVTKNEGKDLVPQSDTKPETPLVPATITEAPVKAAEPVKTDELGYSIAMNDEFIFLNGTSPALPANEAEPVFQPYRELQPDYYDNKYRKHYLLLGGGAFYTPGWKTAEGSSDAAGANFFAALNYGYHLTKKINLETGVEVFNISNIKGAFHRITNTTYGFYYSSSETLVTTTDMLFVAVPLKICFSPSRVHHFNAGLTAALIAAAKNTVTTRDLTDAGSPTVVAADKEVYEGVSPVSLMVSAGYRINVCRKFSLSIDAGYTLSDLFENNSYNNAEQKPLVLKAGLHYTIFNK
jgi:hypothetical protein